MLYSSFAGGRGKRTRKGREGWRGNGKDGKGGKGIRRNRKGHDKRMVQYFNKFNVSAHVWFRKFLKGGLPLHID